MIEYKNDEILIIFFILDMINKNNSRHYLINLIKTIQFLKEKHLMLCIFFMALFVRSTYAIIYILKNGVDVTNDSGDYIQFAHFMYDQGWMVADIKNLSAHSGPGYPLLLYFDHILFYNDKFYFSIFIGILFSSLAVVIIYKLSLLLFHSRYSAIFVAIWAIFYVHFIRYSPFIGKECIIFFLFPFCLYICLKEKRNIVLEIFLFVLAFSWLIHIDERYLIYLPIFLVVLSGLKLKNIKYSIFTLSLVILFMVPWLYRNYVVFQRPVILTERIAKFTDKIIGYDGPQNKYREPKRNYYHKSDVIYYEKLCDSLINNIHIEGKNIIGSKELVIAIKANKIPRTYSNFEKYWYEFAELLRPVKFKSNFTGYGYRYWPKWKISSNIIYGIQYGIILLFSLMGFLKLYYLNKTNAIILFTLVLFNVCFHLFVGHCIQRYRVPIDFIFIILGVNFIYAFLKPLYLKKII